MKKKNKNEVLNEVETLDFVETKTVDKKKVLLNKKTLLIIIPVLLIIVVMFIASNGGIGGLMNKLTNTEVITIKTDTKWGDLYAVAIQKEFVDYDKYDIAFVDVDDNDIPEMLVKYIDSEDRESFKMFYIDKDEVYSTKKIRNYSIKLIHSLIERKSELYIYVESTKGYGSYTKLSEMLGNKITNSSIKATTDKEIKVFKEAYGVGKYSVSFYEVKVNNIEKDFKSAVVKAKKIDSDLEDAISELDLDNEDREYEVPLDNPYADDGVSMLVAGRRMFYGKYVSELDENDYIELSLGSFIYEGAEYSYDVEGNDLIFKKGDEEKELILYISNCIKFDGDFYYHEDYEKLASQTSSFVPKISFEKNAIVVSGRKLSYGKYYALVGDKEVIATLTKDDITLGGASYTFKADGTNLLLSNGNSISIIFNNRFKYGDTLYNLNKVYIPKDDEDK